MVTNDEMKEVNDQLSQEIRDDISVGIDPEFTKKIFTELAKIDGLQGYLVETMAKDVRRYFDEPKDKQDFIRGHYTLARYFYNQIKKFSNLPK